jgi:hypothetical protein
MAKVLIITYYWPPSGGSGVQRWVYFARHLRELGFEPIVITVDETKASYKFIDESFGNLVKEVEVHKTDTFEVLKLYSKIMGGDDRKFIPQGFAGEKKPGFFQRVSRFIRGNFFIPDARVGWVKYARAKAEEIIKKEGIKTVITTGPPHSTHLVGLHLKNKLDINWFADLRDPWTEIYYNELLFQTNYAKNVNKRLEKKVLETANKVTTVGPTLAALLADKLASTQKAKVNVLYNGYDSDKMAGLPAYTKSNKFIISFIGILSDSQPINAFVDGLRLFFMDVDDAINNVEFHSAGEVSNGIEQNLLQVMPATRIVKHGYLPHQKALAQMSASDLLFNSLAEMPESKLLISGKLMEYLASGRPVLCLGDTSGDAANLLNKFERSAIFARDEAEKIAAFIKDIYLLWQKNENGSIVRPGIEEYSRRAVTQKLATLIKTSEQ